MGTDNYSWLCKSGGSTPDAAKQSWLRDDGAKEKEEEKEKPWWGGFAVDALPHLHSREGETVTPRGFSRYTRDVRLSVVSPRVVSTASAEDTAPRLEHRLGDESSGTDSVLVQWGSMS